MITGIKIINVPTIAKNEVSKDAFINIYEIVNAATEKAMPTA